MDNTSENSSPIMPPPATVEMILSEMKDVRSEIGELQKLPERWGTIMLPLSAGIMALAVNSIKDMPAIAVGFMAFLAMSTMIVWRLVGYNALYRIRIHADWLARLEKQIPEKGATALYGGDWQQSVKAPKTFLKFLSLRALLNLLALLYILASVGLVVVKVIWFR
jgi:hypothetical protein